MINLMILIAHHKHQYLFISIWSELKIFDSWRYEIYILCGTEVAESYWNACCDGPASSWLTSPFFSLSCHPKR